MSLTRRTLLAASLAVPALAAGTANAAPGTSIGDLERRHGGRLGVAVLDTETGRRIAHRAGERFAMCSTFKLVAAALVLTRVERGEEDLARRVPIRKEALVAYSPRTGQHVGGEMTVSELCEAALTLSDNTAGNLLLDSFGGPPAWTAYARSLGDPVSRLDRRETALNEATPGDPRDTTSPAAMLGNLGRILLGDALTPRSHERLVSWMRANKTGDRRLRAHLPKSWTVGDKTGGGDHAVANDVAIVWPETGKPILAAVYYAESSASPEERDRVIADVGDMLVRVRGS